MCDGDGPAGTAAPRPAPGPAVDPIALEPVDEVVVTTPVDNVVDGLLAGADGVVRLRARQLGDALHAGRRLTAVGQR